MFCSKCGHQLADGAKFCSVCGQPVTEKGQETNYKGETSGENEKLNWKEYLTMENIERFAPFAALMPLGLWVITGILGGLFGAIPGVGVVFRVIVFVLKILWFAVNKRLKTKSSL